MQAFLHKFQRKESLHGHFLEFIRMVLQFLLLLYCLWNINVRGKNLKKYREKAGLSQQELAKHMAVTRQTISNWERGVSQPDLDSIFLLANEFQVDVTEIIYGKKPND